MGFLDELKEKVSDAGQKTMQKTKELSDTVRINSLISENETKLKGIYAEIGKLYVDLHRQDGEQAFAELLKAVADVEWQQNYYQNQIKEIKGIRICGNCGAEIGKDEAFCKKCGTALPKPAPAPAPAAEEVQAFVEEAAPVFEEAVEYAQAAPAEAIGSVFDQAAEALGETTE